MENIVYKCGVDFLPEEAYERWQKLEAEAEEDIRRGRVKSFDSVEELFDEMEGKPEARKNRTAQKKRS